MLVRTSTERETQLRMQQLGRVQTTSERSTNVLSVMELSPESAAAGRLVGECYASSLLMLCTRCLQPRLTGDYRIRIVLQMLGMLAHLEKNDMLPLLDEGCWRAMLVACAAVGVPVITLPYAISSSALISVVDSCLGSSDETCQCSNI